MFGRFLCAVCVVLVFLGGCAVTGPRKPEPVVFEPEAFKKALYALPSAQVEEGDGFKVSYPGEALFAPMSVLPLPGGIAVLDPLASLIVANPRVGWSGVVRASTDVSAEYDKQLAEKRKELLGTYFAKRGVADTILPLRAEAGEGAPLEISVKVGDQDVPATSSGEKR